MEPVINDENDMDTDQEREQTDQEPTDGEDSVATPSQSRSSSAHPPEDLMDVFDGYSFKGRHSVIIDDEVLSEEEEEEEGEEEEEKDVTGRSILAELNGTAAAETVTGHDEPTPEPKTPEARPAVLPPSTSPPKKSPLAHRPELPPVDTTAKPASVADATPRASEDAPAPAVRPISPVKAVAEAAAAASTGPDIHHKELKKAPVPKPHGQRPNRQRTRREKSGVPALDRDLSDANDEDDVRTERDEDDDWDFIEADGEDRNGARIPSLFARGVVDRYKLSVFRKGTTPNRNGTGVTGEAARQAAADNGSSSPSPTAKDRRGRTSALPSFRRTPKTFLRAKSPPSKPTHSSQSAGKSPTMSSRSASATVSTVSSPQSVRTTLAQPSLKSKESAASVGSPGSSSDASTNGDTPAASDADVVETVRVPQADEQEKRKNKKLKRGAEKMLSLFASPR
jgi:serum/glucocorticoid-regulated kinase 2